MWRRLIFDGGCFSEGVVAKCSAIYAEARNSLAVIRCFAAVWKMQTTVTFRRFREPKCGNVENRLENNSFDST
jgi:hypothetical protein